MAGPRSNRFVWQDGDLREEDPQGTDERLDALPLLAFDTSGPSCAACLLLRDGRVILRDEAMATGQAEHLMPLLEDMLREAGLGWHDLSRIAVGTGPGNFTGVRIAVAAARGLALGLGVPAVGVTRLEALAFGLGPVTVVEDARRGEVYVQPFGAFAEGGGGVQGGGAGGTLVAGVARLVPVAGLRVARAVGSGAALVTGAEVVAPAMPLAEAVARIAARRVPGARPAPFYLRGADAAPPSDPPPVILT